MSMMDDDPEIPFDEALEPPDFAPVPRNIYQLVVSDAVVHTTAKGKSINLSLQVEGGEFDGRQINFIYLQVPNRASYDDPQKYQQAIGRLQQRLDAILGRRLSGKPKLSQIIGMLPGARFEALVNVKADVQRDENNNPIKDQNGQVLTYPPKNTIDEWRPLQKSVAQTPQAVTLGTPAPVAPPQAAPQPITVPQPASAPAPQAAQTMPEQQPPVQETPPAPESPAEETSPAAAFRL